MVPPIAQEAVGQFSNGNGIDTSTPADPAAPSKKDPTPVAAAAQSKPLQNEKPNNNGKAQPGPKPADAAKEGAMSGKEAKLKKQAEKMARRAQEKQIKPGQPEVDPPKANQVIGGTASLRRNSSVSSPAFKVQRKRTGSTSQKILPIRNTDGQSATTSDVKRADKHFTSFDHLHDGPRRTSLAGASKDVHPAVLAMGLKMSSYEICGSSARCVAMLLSLKEFIKSYKPLPKTSIPQHLPVHLSSQIEYLVSCRPLSVSMGNAIRWLKQEISKVDPGMAEIEAKIYLCAIIDNFIKERITVAEQAIATRGSAHIRDGDVIMTFGKSSIVQRVLLEAMAKNTKFSVIIVDNQALHEGQNLACAFSDHGIEAQYSHSNDINEAICSATKCLLGAHAMMSNGGLTSRSGTALVAMNAKAAELPVIVCCQSIKFIDRVVIDSIAHNEIAPPDDLASSSDTAGSLDALGMNTVSNMESLDFMYDFTPADFIDEVVSEYGSTPPSSVPVIQRLSTNT